MKPFNLEEYLNNPSKPLVTRSGLNARIVCDYAPGDFPIIAIIDKMSMVDNCVTHVAYRKEGLINQDGIPSPYDLFFATEKHKGWINIYRDTILSGAYYKYIYPSEEDAKENACSGAIATIKIEWEE